MSDKGTEQASPQKKKKARDSGDIIRSRDLISATAMSCGIVLLGSVTSRLVTYWMAVYQAVINIRITSLDVEIEFIEITRKISIRIIPVLALVLLGCFTSALIVGIIQGGGVILHFESVEWKPERLNPITNLKNLWSARTAVRIAKSIIPVVIMALVSWSSLYNLIFTMPVFATMRLLATFRAAYHLVIVAAGLNFGWSLLDYIAEWHAWNDRLKMTKQELRDELKEASGNPQVKSRFRQIQRLMRRRRIKADIGGASLVITNPTHYAVALVFSFETMQAPTVLAKGRDLYAAEIREEARWSEVPIIENAPLARSLYRSVEPGQSIPFELYQAVAAILAFLYRQKVEEKLRRERHAHTSSKRAAVSVSAIESLRHAGWGM
jgi:flagellar biosynthetic protein FlhB